MIACFFVSNLFKSNFAQPLKRNIKLNNVLSFKIMETKHTKNIKLGKLSYEAPQIKVEDIILEYSVAAGSVQTSGTVQQQWDGEESSTSSQSEGWW